MKKYAFLFLMSVLLSSCYKDEQYSKPIKEDSGVVKYQGYAIETIEYDNHEYIICRDMKSGYHSVSMLHSASCKKCNNDGNNNHYIKKEVIMIEKAVIDTVYVRVPDQDAYNIGYFDGQLDAYEQYEAIESASSDTSHGGIYFLNNEYWVDVD